MPTLGSYLGYRRRAPAGWLRTPEEKRNDFSSAGEILGEGRGEEKEGERGRGERGKEIGGGRGDREEEREGKREKRRGGEGGREGRESSRRVFLPG